MKLPHGIQRKLIVLLLGVSLAPLAVFGLVAYRSGRASLQQKVGGAFEDRAGSAVDKLSRSLFDRYGDIQVIAQNPVLSLDISAPEQKSEVLAAMVRTYAPTYTLVSVTDAAGIVAGSSETSLVGRNESGEEWFRSAMRGDVYYSPEVIKDPRTGAATVVFAAPVRDSASGRLIGVVASWLNWATLFDEGLARKERFGETGELLIVDPRKGRLLAGGRGGMDAVPEELLRPMESLAQNLFISPPTLPQHAAIAAFECRDELDANVARYAQNRALLLRDLPEAGFDQLTPPDGAFYLFADVGHLTNDSREFCRRMLAETGVAVTPGADFDPERGHRYLRFSFAGAPADMAEAVRRLKAWRR